jgi:hypothetical protein
MRYSATFQCTRLANHVILHFSMFMATVFLDTEKVFDTTWNPGLLYELSELRLLTSLIESRDSSVGIALGYGLDDRGSGVRYPAGAGNFSLSHRVQNGSGTHPVSYPMRTRGSFPGVKRPGREADHSPPSSTEVKE